MPAMIRLPITVNSGKGKYCWAKSKVLEDGTKELIGFIAADEESKYPDGEISDGFYYVSIPGGLGEAEASQVLAGVTFSSETGLKQVGTLEPSDSIVLMVQTEDGTYPIGNANEPEQVDENTVSVNIN